MEILLCKLGISIMLQLAVSIALLVLVEQVLLSVDEEDPNIRAIFYTANIPLQGALHIRVYVQNIVQVSQ